MNYNLANYLLEENLSKAQEYLEEVYHPNYVKKNIVPKVAEKFKISNEEVFKRLKTADPSEDGRYMAFLASSWLSKRVEDIDTIQEVLFKLIGLTKVNTKGSKELLSLVVNNKKTLEDVNKFLSNFKEVDTNKNKFDNFKKIISEDGVDVYLVNKFEKAPGKDSHVLFCGTNWCVRKEKMFDDYAPPYYLFIDAETKENIALYHVESSQLKNTDDEPIYGTKEYIKIEKAFYKLISQKKTVTLLWGDDFDEVDGSDDINEKAIVFNFNNLKAWRRIVKNELKGTVNNINIDFGFDDENVYESAYFIFIDTADGEDRDIDASMYIKNYGAEINFVYHINGKQKQHKVYISDVKFDDPKTFDSNLMKASETFKKEYEKLVQLIGGENQ